MYQYFYANILPQLFSKTFVIKQTPRNSIAENGKKPQQQLAWGTSHIGHTQYPKDRIAGKKFFKAT